MAESDSSSNADDSNPPESPAETPVPTAAYAVPNDVENDVENDAPTGDAAISRHPKWVMLIVGVVASFVAACVLGTCVTLMYSSPGNGFLEARTPEADEVGGTDSQGNAIVEGGPEKATQLRREHMQENGRRVYAVMGVALSIVFGLGAVFYSRRGPVNYIIALVAGLLLGGLIVYLGCFGSMAIHSMANPLDGMGDVYGILGHTVSWLLIAIAVAATAAISSGRSQTGINLGIAMAVGGLIGSVVFVFGGSILAPNSTPYLGMPMPYPNSSTGVMTEMSLQPFYLWAMIPPFICGLMMLRMKEPDQG
ncbi:MAG: hypothetical protein AAFN70_00905 [Planctomycetota bacterium]